MSTNNVEKDIKKEKKREKKIIWKLSSEALILILGIIPSLIFLIIVIFQICGRFPVCQTADDTMEGGMFAVISTAVSVWVGLNIYNLITKKDIEGLVAESVKKEMEEQHDIIRRKTDSISERADLKAVLNRTQTKYAFSAFVLSCINELEDQREITLFYGINYRIIRDVEEWVTYCADNYENNVWEIPVDKSEILINRISTILKSDQYTENRLQLYLKWRLGDIYYYRNAGVTRNGNKINEDDLKEALKYYKEAEKMIDMDSLVTDDVKSYVRNTIGYTCRLMANRISNTRFDKKFEMNIEALSYQEKAIKLNGAKGRYFGNTGLIYNWFFDNISLIYSEKYKLQDVCWEAIKQGYYYDDISDSGKIPNPNVMRDYAWKLASKYYSRAIELDKSDNKAFNNLGALILKKMDVEFGVVQDRPTLIGNLSIWSNMSDEKRNKFCEEVNYSLIMLQLSKDISPTFEDCRYNYAKAKIYEYLLTEDVRCLDEALFELDQVRAMNKNNSGIKYIYRNYYEVTDNLDEAIKINKMILPNGDSKKILKLYSQEKLLREASNIDDENQLELKINQIVRESCGNKLDAQEASNIGTGLLKWYKNRK